jgi:hypothetical protein
VHSFGSPFSGRFSPQAAISGRLGKESHAVYMGFSESISGLGGMTAALVAGAWLDTHPHLLFLASAFLVSLPLVSSLRGGSGWFEQRAKTA